MWLGNCSQNNFLFEMIEVYFLQNFEPKPTKIVQKIRQHLDSQPDFIPSEMAQIILKFYTKKCKEKSDKNSIPSLIPK
jgi:hypothetical protein